jgi:hypothetical protein
MSSILRDLARRGFLERLKEPGWHEIEEFITHGLAEEAPDAAVFAATLGGFRDAIEQAEQMRRDGRWGSRASGLAGMTARSSRYWPRTPSRPRRVALESDRQLCSAGSASRYSSRAFRRSGRSYSALRRRNYLQRPQRQSERSVWFSAIQGRHGPRGFRLRELNSHSACASRKTNPSSRAWSGWSAEYHRKGRSCNEIQHPHSKTRSRSAQRYYRLSLAGWISEVHPLQTSAHSLPGRADVLRSAVASDDGHLHQLVQALLAPPYVAPCHEREEVL